MAKLKAPLMSLGASGKLGNALVFFGWKGLNVVREYVVPTNPDTTLQQTQRGYVTAGVAMIHTAQSRVGTPLDRDDQVAYAAWAAAKGKIMTWFNVAVKLWVDVKVAAKSPVIYCAGGVIDTDTEDFRPYLALNEENPGWLADGHFFLGTTKTNLVQSEPATVDPNTSVTLGAAAGFSGLTAGKKYYWQFRPDAGDHSVGADSGIYYAVAT